MNAKEWNLEERQLYDDGDPPQCAKSKAISIWLTFFGICVKWLMPLLMLTDSSKGEEMLNRICKIFGRKGKDWKCPAQVYKRYTCYRCISLLVSDVILGYWILFCWYEMSYKSTYIISTMA
jgi:hypothetical protein